MYLYISYNERVHVYIIYIYMQYTCYPDIGCPASVKTFFKTIALHGTPSAAVVTPLPQSSHPG